MNGEFTEEKIQERFYNHLSSDKSRVVITNWKGWTYRADDVKGGQKTFFHREFDIATFEKHNHELILTGYEVKGYTKAKRKIKNEEQITYEPPPFAAGVDQALVLLLEGADYSYLVIPEPKRDVDRDDLKKLCDDFASKIGLIFVTESGSFWTYREAERHYSSKERKSAMLTSALASGMMGKKRQFTVWAKKHEF